MKKLLLILILLAAIMGCFAENSLVQKVLESQDAFPTFTQITQVSNISQLFDYLQDFISWKHWRFWASVVGMIIVWMIFIMIDGYFREIFSKTAQDKFKDKENIYYIFWIIFAAIVAILFTFWYDRMSYSFGNLNLLELPLDQHWVSWVIWSCLNFLILSAVWALIREIIVFKLYALYTIPYQITHGVIGLVLAFFFTTAASYLLAGLGIVLGIIGAFVIALMILTFLIKASNEPSSSSSSSSSSSYNDASQKITNDSKKRADEQRRKSERLEKFNRDQLKKTRGW